MVARRAHNPEVAGSSPAPANLAKSLCGLAFFYVSAHGLYTRPSAGRTRSGGTARPHRERKTTGGRFSAAGGPEGAGTRPATRGRVLPLLKKLPIQLSRLHRH